MARRRSFSASLVQAQRQAARAQAAQARAHVQAQRNAERAHSAYVRASAVEERERKRLYVESRAAEVAAMSQAVEARVEVLGSILTSSLAVDDYLDFEALKEPPRLPAWPQSSVDVPATPPQLDAFLPPEPSGLSKVFGKAKHEQAIEAGRAAYDKAMEDFAAFERARFTELERKKAAHDRASQEARADAAAQNRQVDAFRQDFEKGDPEAVVSYFELVLNASQYPADFPQAFRLAYVPESRQAIVEYQFPDATVIPAAKLYKYVKASDKVTEAARPVSQVRSLYASVVAQVALRTVHELFEADRGRHIDVIVFNGVLHTVDPGSGKKIKPCLITLRTTRDTFGELSLAQVDPIACLKHLSAGVSRSPAELVAVRPVLEFDMVDPRFVAESEALVLLDERPNLMELTPSEFEGLIQNLFTKMGLEAKQTRPSRDGGVDCVAYDPRPIFGGKVVIQAKRYKNTVGVSAVRDLFGTLQNEGASKGILVATSGYGQASYDFARNKPIELIDGANLLYLLKTYADVDAKILPPDSWTDPLWDVGEGPA